MGLELVAQGPNPRQRWRIELPTGSTFTLGRSSDADLPVPWDRHISRRHCVLTAKESTLEIIRQPEGRNPLFVTGKPQDHATLQPGQSFAIGETTFLVGQRENVAAVAQRRPIEEVAFNRQSLKKIRFHDAETRLEVLTDLPDVIAGAQNDRELHHRLAGLLMRGLIHGAAVAVVSLDPDGEATTLHTDRRQENSSAFYPSRRLIHEALLRRRSTVLYVWNREDDDRPEQTMAQDYDWAFCTPVSAMAGPLAGLYVAGRMGPANVPGATLSDSAQLEGDVKFTELVAEILGSVLKSRKLERQHAGLRQFFAPPILSALGEDLDTALLEPCECDVTVMFCDLRGFSHRAELAADNLLGLLERVSRALGVMTEKILEFGGVTGDFQGDATLGFWGWPLMSQDAPLNACRAALAIRSEFARTAGQKNHPLADFEMGIGIAHGRAVAGKIGTLEQVKVTVFGPVVNLASRLEGMTRQLQASILLDERTAALARNRLDPSMGRLRRLARVMPYGTETPVLVHELLPPQAEMPDLTDEHVLAYEAGVDHFIAGHWEDAYRELHRMPPSDRAHDFLLQQITSHSRRAPVRWDGTIRLGNK